MLCSSTKKDQEAAAGGSTGTAFLALLMRLLFIQLMRGKGTDCNPARDAGSTFSQAILGNFLLPFISRLLNQ